MASSQLSAALLKDSVWYTAAAAAITGLAAQGASAQVVYRDIADVVVTNTFTSAQGSPIIGPTFDFDNDGDAELLIGEAIGAGRYTIGRLVDVDAGADTGTGFIGNVVAGYGYFVPLAAGATIGPANTRLLTDDGAPSFTFNGVDPNGFLTGTDVFIGVQFTLAPAGTPHYGWMRVNMPTAGGSLTVKDLAYQSTPNTVIVAGNRGTTAVEPDALASGYRFSPLAPNPTTGASSFDLSVGQPERVRVEAFDALGRSVAVLHDGPMAVGQTSRLTLDASALPSGVYLVRVAGESFVTSRRVSVTH